MTSQVMDLMTQVPHSGAMDTIGTPIAPPVAQIGLPAPATAAGRAETRLRHVLEANAAFSAISGLTGTLAADWTADRLGLTQTGWVRLISIGLLLFAGAVLVASRVPTDRLGAEALLVSIADLSWVVATVGMAAVGAFSATGTAIAVVTGVVILDFGLTQLWFRSQLRI